MIYIFLFVIGTIFGSFFCLLEKRGSKNESIVFPASHCDYCNRKLKIYELVPIFSFIFLKGRCSSCGKKLDRDYIIYEILGGIFILLANMEGEILGKILLFSAYMIGFVILKTDLNTLEIYSWQVYLLVILGLVYRSLYLTFDKKFLFFILIFSLCYLLVFLLSKKNVGDGDFFYYLGFFMFLESDKLLIFLLFSIWIGAISGLIIGIKNKSFKIPIAFCIYIFIAFIIVKNMGMLEVIFWRKKDLL